MELIYLLNYFYSSGGITISVRGTNLNAVQHPFMYTISDNQEYNSVSICMTVSTIINY